MWTSKRALLIATLLISAVTPLFWLSSLDLSISALFYRGGIGWPVGDQPLLYFFYKVIPWSSTLLGILCLSVIVGASVSQRLQQWRRPAAIVMVAFILGPGLLVNALLKENWGRPRPRAVETFAGAEPYVPPLYFNQCGDGKSFSCGHCSVGFAFIVFAMLARQRRWQLFWLCFTLGVGGFTSLARIAAGGHFLSDALWSAYLAFASGWLSVYLFSRPLGERRSIKVLARYRTLLTRIGMAIAALLVIASLVLFPLRFSQQHAVTTPASGKLELALTLNLQHQQVTLISDDKLRHAAQLQLDTDAYGTPWSTVELICTPQTPADMISCHISSRGFFAEQHSLLELRYNPAQTAVTINGEPRQ